MIRIYVGKSASGKDYMLNRDVRENGLIRVVSTTTRPIRPVEKDGVDYHFIGNKDIPTEIRNEEFLKLAETGCFKEYRCYDTIENDRKTKWYYGSPDLSDCNEKDYVAVVDLGGAAEFVKLYGAENCEIIYVKADDELRFLRSDKRGGMERDEWKRRCIDDAIKFSDEKIQNLANIAGKVHVINNEFEINNVSEWDITAA